MFLSHLYLSLTDSFAKSQGEDYNLSVEIAVNKGLSTNFSSTLKYIVFV